MNVLIVNAFGTSSRGISQFNSFCKIIEQLLKKISYKSGIGNFFYSYRTVENLDDFVYNLPSNEKASDDKKNEFKKNFDKLDFVFIDGKEKRYLPFLSKGFKLLSLIKLCEDTGKALFASGVAMLHLIYLLATSNVQKNIINSNGDYPTIEDLDKISIEYVKNLKRDDAFLDYVTGDVYECNNGAWTPIMNIGVHKLIYAEKFRDRGKYVLKEYHESKNTNLISTNKKEIKTKVLKQYCLHWLVKKVPVEFVAYTSLTWYPHNFCVTNKDKQYKTICDSNFGPMVIEHGNSIGTMFHILSNYGETVKILENFIANKFVDVQTKTTFIKTAKRFESEEAEKLFKSVVREVQKESTDENEGLKKSRPTSKIALVDKSRLFSKIIKNKTEGPHCGFSFSNQNMIFVENNSVIHKDIPLISLHSPTGAALPTVKDITKSVIRDDYDYLKPDASLDDDQLITFYKKQSREICKKLQEVKTNEDTTIHKITKRGLSAQRTTASAHSSKTSTSSSVRSNTQNSRPITAKPSFTKTHRKSQEPESVLTMLFPYIKEEDFQIKEYNPGKSEKKNHLEVIRVNMETKIKSNYKSKFKKYEKELNTFGDKPSIRCSSAYMTNEEARRKEFLESKKYWMCQEDFKKVFGKQTLAMRDREEIMNNSKIYEETKNDYKPVLNYAYRTTDKSKWISKKNFIV